MIQFVNFMVSLGPDWVMALTATVQFLASSVLVAVTIIYALDTSRMAATAEKQMQHVRDSHVLATTPNVFLHYEDGRYQLVNLSQGLIWVSFVRATAHLKGAQVYADEPCGSAQVLHSGGTLRVRIPDGYYDDDPGPPAYMEDDAFYVRYIYDHVRLDLEFNHGPSGSATFTQSFDIALKRKQPEITRIAQS